MEDNNKDDNDNNKDDNDDKVISALELEIWFSRGHLGNQGHQPHDDDNEEEDDHEVKDNNNDKGISALGLDKVHVFS